MPDSTNATAPGAICLGDEQAFFAVHGVVGFIVGTPDFVTDLPPRLVP